MFLVRKGTRKHRSSFKNSSFFLFYEANISMIANYQKKYDVGIM
jgi:hypothetical protein